MCGLRAMPCAMPCAMPAGRAEAESAAPARCSRSMSSTSLCRAQSTTSRKACRCEAGSGLPLLRPKAAASLHCGPPACARTRARSTRGPRAPATPMPRELLALQCPPDYRMPVSCAGQPPRAKREGRARRWQHSVGDHASSSICQGPSGPPQQSDLLRVRWLLLPDIHRGRAEVALSLDVARSLFRDMSVPHLRRWSP